MLLLAWNSVKPRCGTAKLLVADRQGAGHTCAAQHVSEETLLYSENDNKRSPQKGQEMLRLGAQ